MGDEPTVVLVVPIVPAATGNGLAMRAGMLLDALAPVAAVHVVVVPVSGSVDDGAWAAARARSMVMVAPVDMAAAREHTTRQLADPALRDRLSRTTPLPGRAAAAPPTLAAAIAAALPDEISAPSAVLAMRLYLAPLGIELARHLSSPRVVVDADDDDGTLLRALGEQEEADAFDRLARCWLPDADEVLAASEIDAREIARRAGIDPVRVVRNTVPMPTSVAAPPGADRLLFVGNLTYEPNRAAAELLAREILPLVRARRPNATLDLVGNHGGMLNHLAALDGVRVTGAVPDVAPFYVGADVVVVPLRHGAGTRIKVIEAFAQRRPVVATGAAVAGLALDLGHEVVVAESSADLAHAVADLLEDPRRAEAIVERAALLAATRYSLGVVATSIRSAVLVGSAPDEH